MSEVAGTKNEKKAANTDVGMWKSPVHIVLLVFLVMLALTSVQAFIISKISGCENKALNVLLLSGAMIAGAYLLFFIVMRQTAMNMIFHENKITPRGVLLYRILALVGAGFTWVAMSGESCTSDADGTFTKIACRLEDSYRTGIAMVLGVLSFIVFVIPFMVSKVPTPRQRKKAEESAKEPAGAKEVTEAKAVAKEEPAAKAEPAAKEEPKARRSGWGWFGGKKQTSKQESQTEGPPPSQTVAPQKRRGFSLRRGGTKQQSKQESQTGPTGPTGPPLPVKKRSLFSRRQQELTPREQMVVENKTRQNKFFEKKAEELKQKRAEKRAASMYRNQGSGNRF